MHRIAAANRWQRASESFSWGAFLLAALTVLGWITGMEALASVRARYIPMAPTTALAFTILSAGLVAQGKGRIGWRYFAAVCEGLVALLAITKGIEFLAQTSFGIDERLVADPAMFGAVRKGRMSPITATSLITISFGAMCLLREGWRAWAARAAAVTAAVNIVIVIGYLYGTPFLYGGSVIPVALPTAIAFLCSSASVVCAAGPRYWPLRPWLEDSTRAFLVRWFQPLIVAGVIISGLVLTKLLLHTNLNPALIAASTALVMAVLFSATISEVARLVGGRIDRAEAERSAAQAELKALNADLERRIEQRTAELRAKNQDMHEELTMARELQMAMLPKSFPSLPTEASAAESALRFFTFYYPTGDVSGDFFNVFPISENKLGVVVCDVMGHGVRAALVTSMVRALLEQNAADNSDPGELLSRINIGLISILKNTGMVVFVTALVLIADLERQEFTYANAGHPRPLHIRRKQGSTQSLPGPTGPALGLFDGAKYQSTSVEMSAGDLIILFTDGLFEVESPTAELFSQRELHAAVDRRRAVPPDRLFTELLAEVRQFSNRDDFEDDVCIVGVEVTGEARMRTKGSNGSAPKEG